jgi:hypothetical protein
MSERNEPITIGRAIRKEDGAQVTFYDNDTALVERYYRKGIPIRAEYVHNRIHAAFTLAASEMIEAVWNEEEYGPLLPLMPATQPPPREE